MKCVSPIPKGIRPRKSINTEEFAHSNFVNCKYAEDFLVPVGTPILAARGGLVVGARDGFHRWGLDTKFAREANRVVIDHLDGTLAEYMHFGFDKVTVRAGDSVQAGQLLGHTGMSGCMNLPHLHFNVFKIVDGKNVSIPFYIRGEFVCAVSWAISRLTRK